MKKLFFLLAATTSVVFLAGCAQEKQTRLEDIIPSKRAQKVDPFFDPSIDGSNAAVIQNPGNQ